MVDAVRNALDENEVLTEEVKSDLFSLTLLFHKHYKEVPLDKLAKRLRELKVEVISKFIREEAIYYNDKTNTLQINETELSQNQNTKHDLMVSLLHMITLDHDIENQLGGFRDGFAHIIANNLVGSEENE